MHDTKLPGTNPDHEERLSRRDFLLGIAVASAVALPGLSAPARAAVSMLHTGLDPELVKPESEIVRVGRGGGRGGGGRGGVAVDGHGGGGRHMVAARGVTWRSGGGRRNMAIADGGELCIGMCIVTWLSRFIDGRWWRGRYYGYGVGSCWRWTPAGYIWICGY